MVADAEGWIERVRTVLENYDESLLRSVATRLCKPRNQWPAEELIDRSLETLQNPAVLDRRLKDLPEDARKVLAVLRHSGQERWPVGTLCELGALLGTPFDHESVLGIIGAGLAFPDVGNAATVRGKVKNLLIWLGNHPGPAVLVPPTVPQRLGGIALGLDDVLPPAVPSGPIRESDGLEWLIRLAVLHQLVEGGPLRRTQGGELFKRDLDRLRGDALLGASSGEALVELPEPDLFTVALGVAVGILQEHEGELSAGKFPSSWSSGLVSALSHTWTGLLSLEGWNPITGAQPRGTAGPFLSSALFSLVLLAQLSPDRWARPEDIAAWIAARHPYWAGKPIGPEATGIITFLLGIAYPMRLVQATRTVAGDWAVRLSAAGRAVLGLGGEVAVAAFPQTLLVQPNLEILAYRQGLSPDLIPRLGNFATWKTLGAACVLQLEPRSVYHALENGETFASIVQTLDRHGMKPTPGPVLDALRTWADKRDRITVYPSAALFEFASAADLTEALARGLPGSRLTDRLAVVPRESDIDYKHFRLTGTRDYCLPPERCVDVETDGVTLVVDLARSDLLLETELLRFAEPLHRPAPPGKRLFRLTPASLRQARQAGMSWPLVDAWFQQRTGLPGSPAAQLLFSAAELPPAELRRRLVLHVCSAEVGDGLMQWPSTRGLLEDRLGPTALAIAESDLEALRTVLGELGIPLNSSDRQEPRSP